MSAYGLEYGQIILTTNGGAFAFGYGHAGRLATGTSDTSGFTSPERMDLNNIVQMDTANKMGIALTGAGEVYYWPEGLGSSTTSGSSSDYDGPVEMPTSSFTETSAVRFVRSGGQELSQAWWCAVFDNEYAPPECWGDNSYYQLAQVCCAVCVCVRECVCEHVYE